MSDADGTSGPTDDRTTSGRRSPEERLAIIKALTIIHPQFRRARELIAEARRQSALLDEPIGVAVLGYPGAGKTTLNELVIGPQRSVDLGLRDNFPGGLTAKVPHKPTIKKVCRRLIRAIDPKFTEGRDDDDLTEQLLILLKNTEVPLITLDEFQHFVEVGKEKTHVNVASWLKELTDTARVPIVIFGVERSARVFELDEQIDSRFKRRVEMSPFDWYDAASRADFRGFLKSIAAKLPFGEVEPLHAFGTALRLHCASDGKIRPLMTIIRTAAASKAMSGGETLTMADLAEAYARTLDRPELGLPNPFLAKLDEDRARRELEEIERLSARAGARKPAALTPARLPPAAS